jgi:hypothetical protein
MAWYRFRGINYKKHRNEIGITSKTKAYIQSLVLKKEHFLN